MEKYDIYKNTKQVLKSIRTEHADRLQTGLPSQGFIISFLLVHSLKNLHSLWSRAQSKLPAKIFTFTIKYLNNTLATRKNFYLWGLSNTSDCSFCLQPESLLHIVAGCKTYLNQGRSTWRHNTALRFLAQTFQSWWLLWWKDRWNCELLYTMRLNIPVRKPSPYAACAGNLCWLLHRWGRLGVVLLCER